MTDEKKLKKEIKDLYSKRRYMLIDKINDCPLRFQSVDNSWEYVKGSNFCSNEPALGNIRQAVVFKNRVNLDKFVIESKTKEGYKTHYRSINPYNKKNKKKLKLYLEYESAKKYLVYKRLSKNLNIVKIEEKLITFENSHTEHVYLIQYLV